MMIEVCGARRGYGDFLALDDVDLAVPRGSLTALVGPSGSGKSTLLRVIAGLEVPDAGTVLIDGRDVTAVPVRRRGIGFVFQHYAAFPHMTVRQNIGFGLKVRKQKKAAITAAVDELLEVTGLTGYADRYPAQLSGGQRQRMALARALAIRPKVLLLDEPFGALDAMVRADLRTWLRRLHEDEDVTTVMVTHDQQEALDVADRIAVLRAGRIEQAGTPDELYDSPATAFVMSFLGPVARLNGEWLRPHDLTVTRTPQPASFAATVTRIARLGFEVRLELAPRTGAQGLVAQLTREQARDLGARVGETLFVRHGAPADVPARPAALGAG